MQQGVSGFGWPRGPRDLLRRLGDGVSVAWTGGAALREILTTESRLREPFSEGFFGSEALRARSFLETHASSKPNH